MIDMSYAVGDRVRNITEEHDFSVDLGDVGVITQVDPDDKVMTYKVLWRQSDSYPVWWCNTDLDPVVVADDNMECNWKSRALKAEKEIRELKNALKTLSEG